MADAPARVVSPGADIDPKRPFMVPPKSPLCGEGQTCSPQPNAGLIPDLQSCNSLLGSLEPPHAAEADIAVSGGWKDIVAAMATSGIPGIVVP